MRDFYLVGVIGFLVGWLVALPAANIGVPITPVFFVVTVVGFTVFAPFALWILKLLSRTWGVFEQFGKFAAVGTLNTLVDLGILNLFILVTNLASGVPFVGFKTISFLVATTNSYFWNKFWTFGSRMPVTGKEYLRFALFTLGGTLINVGIASLVVNVIGAPNQISPKLWANIGALCGVFAGFMWNFLSYKFIVFKGSMQNSNQ